MHDVNLLAVVVSALVYYFIGAIWYSPLLFVKPWMKSMGMGEEAMAEMKTPAGKSKAMKSMVAQFFVCLLIAYIFAITLKMIGADSVHWYMISAFWLWLGFRLTGGLTSVFFEKKSWTTLWINQGYDLIGFIAMAGILGMWK